MFDRIGRTFSLLGSSVGVLRKDPELSVLTVISGGATLAVSLAFAFGFGLFDALAAGRDPDAFVAPGLILYVVTYTIGIFFQSAVVAGALERMGGGDPTISSALRAAMRRVVPILLWGVIAGTVGWIISTLQQRSGVVGSIIAGVIGVVWSLATFFVVPIIVTEELGIGASFRRSWELFKKTWGETVVGGFGLGLLILGGVLVLVAVVAGLAAIGLPWVALVFAIVGGVVLIVATMTLQAIFVAALYRYASTGQVAAGFDQTVLASVFQPKGRA